ncbi:NAD/NADP octopine/nopaline dehydrogenase family protein [Gordonia sp. X0973]|uniref:NAD/NADP octopine/nopaline dehydrogenase family protein n=1 Tax=Gordonia sp. X0973 TaxID=2742602 RepID=UPI0013EA701D|nr:NAD/NADP octopine/nopaline dehydrogenase family protein [Gordonia sp. X0973]QKT08257.1 NAD/NADP octopine/nopaline dehydrogenase family protein [Gordonia sp. X0973]
MSYSDYVFDVLGDAGSGRGRFTAGAHTTAPPARRPFGRALRSPTANPGRGRFGVLAPAEGGTTARFTGGRVARAHLPADSAAHPATETVAMLGSAFAADQAERDARATGWHTARVPLFPFEGADSLVEGRPAALAEASIVVVATPAATHPTLTVLLRDCLRPGALLVLAPGAPGAADEFAAALDGIVVAETGWAPWQSVRDATVPTGPVPLAAAQPGAATDISRRLAPLFASVPVASTAWTALYSPDTLLRTAPMLLLPDAAPTTLGQAVADPAVAPVLAALDEERAAVAAALGLSVPRLAPALAELLGTRADSIASALGRLADGPVCGDPDLVPYGLVPTVALASRAGVAAPVAQSLVDIADKLLGNDFTLAGRSQIHVDLGVRS